MTPPAERRSTESHEQKVQKSLTACTRDGVAAQVMISTMDNYATPLALQLGATNPQIGFLTAIPNLIASGALFLSVPIVNAVGSRRKVITIGVFIQALFLLPIAFLPLLDLPHRIGILIAAMAVYKIIGSVLGPAWGSLVSEYLPAHRRGDYFGWRSRLMGITSLATLAGGGALLYVAKRHDNVFIGFAVLFSIAIVARFFSSYLISQMLDLPQHKSKESEFTFWMFLKRYPESNFVKFVFYVASITFTTYLSAPYFSVYMLRDLKFDYLSYMAITLASTFTSLIAFPIWGRHADVVGNARILKTTSIFIPLIPLAWIFIDHVVPLTIVELGAGFIWGGFNLCAVNYIYDAVSPAKRVRCLGYFNVINGTAIFLGSWLGGVLADRLPPLFGYPLLSLFLISAVGRFAAYLFMSKHFTEVRMETKKVSSFDLFFSVAGVRPVVGRGTEMNVIKLDAQFGKRPEPPTSG